MTTTEERAAHPAVAPDVPGGRGRRLLRGRPDDPRWSRPVLALLLVATAVTYLWDLGASGYANSFYAAAVQAGTQSPKAWLFGALDAPGLITVDKPPAAMWVMALSGRIFGFSSWSMLVPQALMGVAAVALLYATVRRWSGVRTALAAAAMFAFTPVAVLMFKFNNPDALLVLCMIAAAYATTRAIDAAGRRAGTGWIVAAGALVGLGFLTKLLQVLLVLPALALVYVLVADTPWRRRILDLVAAGVAIVVSAGWYVLLVELWPASSRPYIGGSTNNSLLELALGYNGLGRIVGGEGNGGGGGGRPSGGAGGAPPGAAGGAPGGPGGGGGGGGFGGTPSPWRMFNTEFAGQASWLLPAALLLLVAGLWFSRRVPRTDRPRGLLVLGGAWMLVHAIVFSAMSGTIHPYYTVALAPGIALTVAAGASLVWRHRAQLAARIVLAVSVLGTAAWSAVLLTSEDYASALRWVVLVAGVLGAVGLLVVGRSRGSAHADAVGPDPAARPARARRFGTLGVVTVVVALVGALGASTAYAAVTAVTPHTGSIVSAGASGGMGGMGGPGGGTGARGDRAARGGAAAGATGTAPGAPGAAGAGAQGGGMGGMEGETPSAALVTLLQQAGTRWAAATSGAQSSASLQLASNVPVMALGGFTGSDPAPTLAQFQAYVASGQVRYFVVGGGPGGGGGGFGDRTGQARAGQAQAGQGGPGGGSGDTSQISTWVAQHFTATQVGGRTVYDLSHPTS